MHLNLSAFTSTAYPKEINWNSYLFQKSDWAAVCTWAQKMQLTWHNGDSMDANDDSFMEGEWNCIWLEPNDVRKNHGFTRLGRGHSFDVMVSRLANHHRPPVEWRKMMEYSAPTLSPLDF